MSELFETGFAVGVCLAIVLLSVIALLKKNKRANAQYDERQLIARNAAYKYAFWTLINYTMACALVSACEIKWAEVGVQMFIGFYIAIMVFVCICIRKEAYFGISENKKASNLWIIIPIGILNLSMFIRGLLKSGLEYIVTDGMLNIGIVIGLNAVFLLAVSAILMVQYSKSKRTVDEE